jgi:imidazoleglycerol phosphate synthase glutamine amidotransferase subunit HisH
MMHSKSYTTEMVEVLIDRVRTEESSIPRMGWEVKEKVLNLSCIEEIRHPIIMSFI